MENSIFSDDIDALIEAWPKRRDTDTKNKERSFLHGVICSTEEMNAVKDAVEIKIEDTAPNKLPPLGAFVKEVLLDMGAIKSEAVVTTTSPTVSPYGGTPFKVNVVETITTGLYQNGGDDAEALAAFEEIWQIWPRNPDFIERRQNALAAFLSVAKGLTLADLKTACHAYSDSFGDGSRDMDYAKGLKNFVLDREVIEHWLQVAKRKVENEIDKKYFEAAYAWFPDFNNKASVKTKESSWVHYWRKVAPEERLDFQSACRCYRHRRRTDWREADDMTMKDIAKYTKSFVSFVSEWKEATKNGVYSKRELAEAKRDMIAKLVVENLKNIHNLDVVDLWGGFETIFFVDSAMMYYFGEGYNFKDTIVNLLGKCRETYDYISTHPEVRRFYDPDKIKQQVEALDPIKVAELLYQEMLDGKLTEMPSNMNGGIYNDE